jgi:host factor-I protein
MVNRKLFRPALPEVKEQQYAPRQPQPAPQQGPRKKPAPPEQTHAESFYYVKQMQARTPVAVVLNDGETLRGTVEWYDRDCIKLTRTGSPNLLIYKHCIRYLYKEGEDSADGGSDGQ